MSFGKTVGSVRYTRTYAGEPTAALVKSGGRAKNDAAPVEEVTVKAVLTDDGTYTLTVEAVGQSTTLRDVHADELGDCISRLIEAVSKAVRNGELSKARQAALPHYGMGTPVPNRDNLRFG